MKPTVYLETTIVSYLTARDSADALRQVHQTLTKTWWNKAMPLFDLVISDVVIEEASLGDPEAAAKRLAVLKDISSLPVIEPTQALARAIVVALALPARARADAAHLAIAAVHRIPFLLTWNCRHLANGALMDRIDQTWGSFGLVSPRILSPEMLMEFP